MIESDFELAINAVVDNLDGSTIIANLIEDLEQLSNSFMNVQFSYCSRAANRDMDLVAKRIHF